MVNCSLQTIPLQRNPNEPPARAQHRKLVIYEPEIEWRKEGNTRELRTAIRVVDHSVCHRRRPSETSFSIYYQTHN